jgi:hypothetical protein
MTHASRPHATAPSAGARLPRALAAAALLLAPAAATAQEQDLAQQLSNPVADLVSVPFQLNWDRGIGPDGDGERLTYNIQPVVPISLGPDWNLISRTILPIVRTDGPDGTSSGVGDVLQSFFFSPARPTARGWIWGVGPALLLPVGEEGFGAETFAAGPTAVALRQQGPWTYGGLANHLWSAEHDPETEIDQTFLQPFLAYATPSGVTWTINSESTYDWEADQWSVPINAVVTKVTRIGTQPVSFGVALRYWAESPENGPEGFGARAIFTLVFPKG